MNVLELLNKSVYSLTEEEVNFMLDYYSSKEDAYMYHDKVEKLEKQLTRLEGRKKKKEDRERETLSIINEIVSIQNKWKDHGAYFNSKPSYDIWYYNDRELYTSWSGVNVHDVIHDIRKADEMFDEMVK